MADRSGQAGVAVTDPRATPPPEIDPDSDPNEPIGSISLAAVVAPVAAFLLCVAAAGALISLLRR